VYIASDIIIVRVTYRDVKFHDIRHNSSYRRIPYHLSP